jgi:hypothetical protein
MPLHVLDAHYDSADAARDGANELYETTQQHDGTAQNPDSP